MTNISIKSLLLRFRWRILFTFVLVTLEALTGILFPLLIGIAINGLLEDSFDGILYLSIAGAAALIVGSARRFYDTRIYSGIYCKITPEMIENETNKDASVSRISARTGLLTEFVEFLENSMPEMITALISVVGILAIIATLNINVFFACLSLLGLIVLIYTPITVIGAGVLNYGLVFSIVMYVFDYTGSIVSFPLFIQQTIRLKEISARLAKP